LHWSRNRLGASPPAVRSRSSTSSPEAYTRELRWWSAAALN